MTVSPFLLCALAYLFNLVYCAVAPPENASFSILPEELLQLIFRNCVSSFPQLVQVNTQWERAVREVAASTPSEDFASISLAAADKFKSEFDKVMPKNKLLQYDGRFDVRQELKPVAESLSGEIFKIYEGLSFLGFPQDCIQMFAEDLVKRYVQVLIENKCSEYLLHAFPDDLISDYVVQKLDMNYDNYISDYSEQVDQVKTKKWADGLIKVILMLKSSGAPVDFLTGVGRIVYSTLRFTGSSKRRVHFLAWCLSQCQLNFDGQPVPLQTDSQLPDLNNELKHLFDNINFFENTELSPNLETLHKYVSFKSDIGNADWSVADLRKFIDNCSEKTLAVELFLRNVIQSSQNELLAEIWRDLDFDGIHFIIEYMVDLYGNRGQKALLDEWIAS